MTILRATQKVLKLLPKAPAAPEAESTGALGDWYVNRIVLQQKPLLLCVSAQSLLSILAPANDVKAFPERLPELVRQRLLRMGIAEDLVTLEVAAMHPVHVGPTKDRSVLGTMVDFAKMLSFQVERDEPFPALAALEDFLGEVPCRCGGSFSNTIFPDVDTPKLLAAKWRPGALTYQRNFSQTRH
jgi:hypothetical protein